MKLVYKPLASGVAVAATLVLSKGQRAMSKRESRHGRIDWRYVRQLEERIRRLEYLLAALVMALLAAALQALVALLS